MRNNEDKDIVKSKKIFFSHACPDINYFLNIIITNGGNALISIQDEDNEGNSKAIVIMKTDILHLLNKGDTYQFKIDDLSYYKEIIGKDGISYSYSILDGKRTDLKFSLNKLYTSYKDIVYKGFEVTILDYKEGEKLIECMKCKGKFTQDKLRIYKDGFKCKKCWTYDWWIGIHIDRWDTK